MASWRLVADNDECCEDGSTDDGFEKDLDWDCDLELGSEERSVSGAIGGCGDLAGREP
jgi:hypothetical protein